MPYTIDQSQLFLDQFRLLPAELVPRVQRNIALLKQDPRPLGKNRTALRGTKDPKQYRLRVGKYRLIYSFDDDTIWLRNVDTRDDVYVRNTARGYVSVSHDDDIADDDETLEVEVAELEVHQPWNHYRQQLTAWVDAANVTAIASTREAGTHFVKAKESVRAMITPAVPTKLPGAITVDILTRIDIPEAYHQTLVACTTDADLVAAIADHGVDASSVDRVFNLITETIEDPIIPQPFRKLRNVEDLQRFYDGDLLDFQVSLDAAQKPVSRLITSTLGAWLITGAPGTGKSTVLLDAALDEYQKGWSAGQPPSILITTYTNALVTTLQSLVTRMFAGDHSGIQIRTVDSVALEIVEATGKRKVSKRADSVQGLLRPIVEDILDDGVEQQDLFEDAVYHAHLDGEYIKMSPLANMTWSYLFDEIEDVIIGRNVIDREDYLTFPRTGRRVSLSDTQRNRIWDIHMALARELDYRGWTTYPRTRQRAANLLASGEVELLFDAIFVDEAQDVQPNGICMLVEMAKSKGGEVRRLCLSADRNQTIYGSGYSWVSIHPDLKLQGRSRSLTVNHRSTRQIVQAARAYLSGAELDRDKDELEHMHTGPRPFALTNVHPSEEVSWIWDYFATHTGQIGRGYDMCAVLVPDNRRGARIQSEFTAQGIPAAFMRRKDVNLTFPGVKIMTRHAAKGLEFPIVALALATAKPPGGKTSEELLEASQLERRLNHMAMTRSMRSLLVLLPGEDPDEYPWLSQGLWDTVRIEVDPESFEA